MEIKGCTALITGGGTGIGKGVSLKLAEAGANICINYRVSKDDAMQTQREIQAMGVECRLYQADIGIEEDVIRMVGDVIKDFGGIDILVNCAGKTYQIEHSDLKGMKSEYFDAIFNVNIKGMFFCCREAEETLRKNKGVIINIASTGGINGYGSCIAYAASKAAIINMTRSLSRVFAPDARVLCVSPGLVATRFVNQDRLEPYAKQTPMGRVSYPEDIAQAVYGLITSADFVTGINMVVDGGRVI